MVIGARTLYCFLHAAPSFAAGRRQLYDSLGGSTFDVVGVSLCLGLELSRMLNVCAVRFSAIYKLALWFVYAIYICTYMVYIWYTVLCVVCLSTSCMF